MHDGSEDPTAECSLCGEELWLGYIRQCSECDKSYCEDCRRSPEACKICDECGEMVCETEECESDGTELCKACSERRVGNSGA